MVIRFFIKEINKQHMYAKIIKYICHYNVQALNIPVNPGVIAASFRDKVVRSSIVLIGWRCTRNIDALKYMKQEPHK